MGVNAKKTIILLIPFLLLLASCVGPSNNTIKIGVILPLTGEYSEEGLNAQKGLELAIKEINQKQILNAELTHIVEDSTCDQKKAVTAIQKLIAGDGVRIVIGGICSEPTKAAALIAKANNVVMVSPSYIDSAKENPFLFSVATNPISKAHYDAEILEAFGTNKVALLSKDNNFEKDVEKELAKLLEDSIVARESFNSKDDVQKALTKIKVNKPEVIVVINQDEKESAQVLHMINDQNLAKKKMLSIEEINDKSQFEDFSDLTITKKVDGNIVFNELYKRVYNEDAKPISKNAYDAIKAVTETLQFVDPTGLKIKDALPIIEFDGATGYVEFNDDGNSIDEYETILIE